MKKLFFALALAAVCLVSCKKEPESNLTLSGLDPANFVAEVDGAETGLYTLTNSNGMEVCITNFGGRIVSVMVPDRDSIMHDVVLGFDNIQDYMTIPSDFGATIGRYANRIANGRFTLDKQTYELPTNNNGHTLHGGPEGWQYKVFSVEDVSQNSLQLKYVSKDGEMGFPGEVTAYVFFTVTDRNSIIIDYMARTMAPTVINMTNHSYFNLSGDPSQPITDHLLYLNADQTTPVDEWLIPTGKIVKVADTPFDFRTPKPIGQDIDADNEQIRFGRGFDHNWILNTEGSLKKVAATLVCPKTGIELRVFTSEPGIQVYTGNFLDGTVAGKDSTAYQFRTAVCLETQHYPDSPNKPQFPSTELRPGTKFESSTVYRFGIF
ncbi:MAG: galactose mutarotase [Bacteroidales bacterium]|nr:galactose mutarotase [Bacteroidales bacterium]